MIVNLDNTRSVEDAVSFLLAQTDATMKNNLAKVVICLKAVGMSPLQTIDYLNKTTLKEELAKYEEGYIRKVCSRWKQEIKKLEGYLKGYDPNKRICIDIESGEIHEGVTVVTLETYYTVIDR